MRTVIRRQWRGVLFLMAMAILMVPALPALAQGVGNQDQQSVARSFQIFDDGEAVRLPLYEGTGPEGDTVWFVITEASTEDAARRFGVTYSPKLMAVGNQALQDVELEAGMGAVKWRFEGSVDFSPERVVVPGPDGFPPEEVHPGAIGDELYSPLVRLPDGTILNAPVVGNSTGWADKVIEVEGNKVLYANTEGFYEDEEIYYASFDASDFGAAALEGVTYAPRLANVPGAVSDLLNADELEPISNPRSGIVAFTNGPTEEGMSQGLNAALLGLEGPLNVTQSIPGEDQYSPLWNVFITTWEVDPTVQTDFEAIVELAEDGDVTSEGGFIVNCPVMSREK